MTVKRMDNVGIVVEDIDAAIEFFTAPPTATVASMFTVEDIDDTLARLSELGAAVVDEVVNYEGIYRVCYIRGPEGILIGLAQQLAPQTSRENPMERTRSEVRRSKT